MTAPFVRPLGEDDWPAVEAIYREGIDSGHATFESSPPTWEGFDAGKHPDLRIVAVDDSGVLGWAAASPVSGRPVYSGVVEHSVYVAATARGRGVGGLLLAGLIDIAERHGIWTIQSSIFPENIASLQLHQRHGFREVGRRERIALMGYGPEAGVWRDTILVERRSALWPRDGNVRSESSG
ncbi:phosphinothricin acetyltransferase [Conyzicola lurida]|uniref:Phosphinothricin acetyltransferase n=1 Tax=Conyzicola lurida TaxID=1172621 RepID=A0A841AJ79_9MICO|nr:GNAT family N-acetyltransferase [Conyzicola lurida]MBB5843960.1 phosphinothricin acetyltransferase [Conyzicola lurida]